MSSPQILLGLNQTKLLFLPDVDAHGGRVVQVSLRAAKEPTADALASFFLAQREISELIAALAAQTTNLATPAALELAGEGYALRAGARPFLPPRLLAESKPWQLAREQTLALGWGAQRVRLAPLKWAFVFECDATGNRRGSM
ncbi:hypothetical protein GLOTRDRAFT_132152 [Gloeophyllum trabeum ATCC 11539]|uniref:Uncharacterized protein n=1 Tax=Gloeophyllum trabeum (strain ATCC 11539 / FP-39264 / Madison 617) TaxID=670483 RepID=S7PWN9_GLOTA|nr:uncharacterized protein GLOTRDRAFT_132152 [Gloeophyllum trabeum ATCC 11539]EPQ52026.1 hypothetical protein GLOTRDRAFT_132152 [Gloeophyllum trabeum ATCC 11539]